MGFSFSFCFLIFLFFFFFLQLYKSEKLLEVKICVFFDFEHTHDFVRTSEVTFSTDCLELLPLVETALFLKLFCLFFSEASEQLLIMLTFTLRRQKLVSTQLRTFAKKTVKKKNKRTDFMPFIIPSKPAGTFGTFDFCSNYGRFCCGSSLPVPSTMRLHTLHQMEPIES